MMPSVSVMQPNQAVVPRVALGALGAAIIIATFLAVAPGWSGVMSLFWLALAAVTWRWPVVGIAVLVLALPLEQQAAVPTVIGSVTPVRFAGWALVAGGLPRLAWQHRVSFDGVALPHIAVVAALVASVAAGGVRLLTWWQEIAFWMLMLLVYVTVRSLRLSITQARPIVLAVAAGVMLNGVIASSQLFTGAGPESFRVGGMVRVFGSFTHPNTLSAWLAIALPPLLGLSFRRRAGVDVWIVRLAVIVGLATLLFTQSRGGWLAFGGALLVLLALAARPVQRWAVAMAAALALLAVAAGMVAAIPGVERFASIAAVDNERAQVTPATWGQLERQAHWGAAWSMMTSDPFFGVGAGEFNDAYREHTPAWRFRIGRGHAHNAYLHLGAEAGVPGILAFAGWVAVMLGAIWRRVLRTARAEYLLAVGALGSTVAWAIDGVFEYQNVLATPILFIILIALALGGSNVSGNAQQTDGSSIAGARS